MIKIKNNLPAYKPKNKETNHFRQFHIKILNKEGYSLKNNYKNVII